MEASNEELTYIVVELLKGKYKTNIKKKDIEFINDAKTIVDNGKLKENIKLTFGYEFLLRLTHNGCRVMTVPRVGYEHVNLREDSLFWMYRNDETKKLLTPYAKQISELRRIADELRRTDVDIDNVIAKLLKRKNEVLVKQLAAFYVSSRRSEEVFSPLLTVQDKKEVAIIQKFVAEEINQKRLDIKELFLNFA